MSERSEWAALSARIEQFEQVASRTCALGVADDKGIIDGFLIPEATELKHGLEGFGSKHAPRLRKAALDAIATCIESIDKHVIKGTAKNRPAVMFLLAIFGVARGRVDHAFSDADAVAKSLTDRAFTHLRRSIVVDEDLREKWQAAFGAGEPRCEKMGSVHLLSHGIWAFKAVAGGGATDLVLGEPLKVTAEVEAAADALVLTEWKKVDTKKGTDEQKKETEGKTDQAFAQASQYGKGLLGGFELRSYRYLVLVSEKRLAVRDDFQKDGITYRVVNVPVDPETPSKSKVG